MLPAIGIDTGGTYTDAVLFDRERGVLAGAKALTTRENLALGISEAISTVLSHAAQGSAAYRVQGGHHGVTGPIAFVSVSTTLATNALAEHTGASICAVLLGYPDHAIDHHTAEQAFGQDPVVHLAGGHTVEGDQQEPLDEEGLRRIARDYGQKVRAFAVSGYFSVRNPEHETRAREILEELTGLPVSCGHELSSRLHAGRRALTTAWNARLIPLLTELVAAVRQVMAERELTCPLMVVKGDGSLVTAERAREHPVQTILSGPAASVVGAQFLHGLDEACVVDIGGTTTDIAFIRGGRPVVSSDGARVGGLRTMVPAVQMHTYALGGDSAISLAEDGRVLFGPGRVAPVSLTVHRRPEALREVEGDLASAGAGGEAGTKAGGEGAHTGTWAGGEGAHTGTWPGTHTGIVRSTLAAVTSVCRYVAPQGTTPGPHTLSATQEDILRQASAGVASCRRLRATTASAYRASRDLERLVRAGYLTLCGLTPSDAAHVLGRQDSWDRTAAEMAVLIFYHHALSRGIDLAPGARAGAGTANEAGAVNEAGAANETGAANQASAANEAGAAAASPGVARAVAERLVALFVSASARAVLEAAITESTGASPDREGPLSRVLLQDAVAPAPASAEPTSAESASAARGLATPASVPRLLNTTVALQCPIIAVGAPAGCYYSDVARTLHTTAVIPRWAEIANAIGAVVGEVRAEVTVRIIPIKGGDLFRLHGPDGTEDFESLERAEERAVQMAEAEVHRLALTAGAEECQVMLDHHRRTSEVLTGEMLIELEIRAVAIGRPRIGA